MHTTYLSCLAVVVLLAFTSLEAAASGVFVASDIGTQGFDVDDCSCLAQVRAFRAPEQCTYIYVLTSPRMQSLVTKASIACVTLALFITHAAALDVPRSPLPLPQEPVATCDVTNTSPLIQKSDCAEAASYLEEIGQNGTGCGSKQAYHDENGCTWMNTHGTCNVNICNFRFEPSGLNCSIVAEYIRKAYNGCDNDDGTLPAASYPVRQGGFVSVTYNGEFEQQAHP